MIRLSLSEIARLTAGRLLGNDAEVLGVTTDSRDDVSGRLFVAIKGERSDGHAFAEEVIGAGAAGVLAEEDTLARPVVRVADSQRALGTIAGAWRARFPTPLIGVTGSNGKTSVRSMISSILTMRYRCLSTHGNFNNELGLPLTLSRLNDSHERIVLEMGASKPGDIAYLANIARPQVAVITNAASAHLLGMGSVDKVASTKGEIIESLPEDGVAVLNADDDYLDFWKRLAGDRRVATFGLVDRADVQLVDRQITARGQQLKIATPFWNAEVSLAAAGRHNAANALAAAAASIAAGARKQDVVSGLNNYRGVAGRLEIIRQPAGWTLIEDSYNANPASLASGVEVLAEQPGERWLVLGDMAELGPDAAALHFQSGAHARRCGIDRLFAVGELSYHAVQAFGAGGAHFADHQALVDELRRSLHADVVCMVKGSRSSHMEDVSAGLAAPADASGDTPCS